MKNIYFSLILFAICFFSSQCLGQSPYDSLTINDVKARIFPANDLFKYIGNSIGYEVPIGNGKGTIFSSQMWIGGVDRGGNLLLAAQTYHQSGTDFWPGPLDTASVSTDAQEISNYNYVWKISQADIDGFINFCNTGLPLGYVIPQNILTWPGNGDQARSEGHFLAPFVENPNKPDSLMGIYSPADCDYPCIKGDEAIFYVFNDEGNIHTETGGAPLGIEVRAMVYGFNNPNDTAIYNTIFVNYEIINRSSDTILNVYIGNWTDTDIGYSSDDYIGCDVSRSSFYGYNGEAVDPTYGNHPPAQGMVMLKGPIAQPQDIDTNRKCVVNEANETYSMSNYMSYNNDFTVRGNPLTASEYYKYMMSDWIDGTHLTYDSTGYGGTIPCNYMFPDTSDPTGCGTGKVLQPRWSEVTANDVPGDRRGLGTWGPFTFLPGQSQCIDYAYVTAIDTNKNNLTIINTLQQRIDSVKSFYGNHPELQTCGCTSIPVAVNNIQPPALGFTIFPNPANSLLTIHTSSYANWRTITVSIMNVLGQEALPPTALLMKGEDAVIDISKLSSGIYFVQMKSESGSAVKKFVKE